MTELNSNTEAGTQAAAGIARKDKIGRALMTVVALLTVAAFVDGLRRMGLANPDRIWVETWRTFGYVVFVGLFTLLALRPRNFPALWELVMAHKLSVSLFGLWLGSAVPEVSVAVKMDLLLVGLIAPAWVLCRGWMGWSTWRTPDPLAAQLR